MSSTATDKTYALPEEFLHRLAQIIPAESQEAVVKSFSEQKPVTFRINTLHDRTVVQEQLARCECAIEEVPWYPDTYLLSDREQAVLLDPLVQAGQIYRQGLSSMLAALILDPQPGESVLDACAAPGSKTTHIAALMRNTGRIVAVERVKARLYKLRAVLKQQGVTNTETMLMDVRRLRNMDGLFDRVLVDAPCSSEGRFQTFNKRSLGYWSLRKIREMLRKQRGIIRSAARLLKPGGTLVYATCTFAPEENEKVVDWFTRKTGDAFCLQDIHAICPDKLQSYPALTNWRKATFHPDIRRCLRVLPTDRIDAFFMAKWRKVGAT